MVKEITLTETYCDTCNTKYPDPVAIAGYASNGWEHFDKYDLCVVCAGLLKLKAVECLSPKNFELILNEIKEQRGDLSFTPRIFVNSVV